MPPKEKRKLVRAPRRQHAGGPPSSPEEAQRRSVHNPSRLPQRTARKRQIRLERLRSGISPGLTALGIEGSEEKGKEEEEELEEGELREEEEEEDEEEKGKGRRKDRDEDKDKEREGKNGGGGAKNKESQSLDDTDPPGGERGGSTQGQPDKKIEKGYDADDEKEATGSSESPDKMEIDKHRESQPADEKETGIGSSAEIRNIFTKGARR
ncbi:hypothetical protein TWF718_004138 [Orbilia javanica]|uniref:Uncharacterized protein n=1 Tax=Orbilia javanica TaxID=47235 RepID=A0AAN8MUK3_9PEZI